VLSPTALRRRRDLPWLALFGASKVESWSAHEGRKAFFWVLGASGQPGAARGRRDADVVRGDALRDADPMSVGRGRAVVDHGVAGPGRLRGDDIHAVSFVQCVIQKRSICRTHAEVEGCPPSKVRKIIRRAAVPPRRRCGGGLVAADMPPALSKRLGGLLSQRCASATAVLRPG
jgi:hypothetical protein